MKKLKVKRGVATDLFVVSIHLSSCQEDLQSSSNEGKRETATEIWAFCIKSEEETSSHKRVRKKKVKMRHQREENPLDMTSTLLCAVGKLNGPGLGVLWQHLAWLSLHILPHCCFCSLGS